jgi:hypothetical protein
LRDADIRDDRLGHRRREARGHHEAKHGGSQNAEAAYELEEMGHAVGT